MKHLFSAEEGYSCSFGNTAFSEDFVFSFPEELSIYSKDVNFDRLKIQIQMLPDLLKSYNVANPSQKIKNVTNLRTVCDIMNSIESSKVMLSASYFVFQLPSP